jgi:hypothetical protein
MVIFPSSGAYRPSRFEHPHCSDLERAQAALDVLSVTTKPMIRTAAAGADPIGVLLEALAGMDLNVNINLGDLLTRIKAKTDSGDLQKFARQVDGSREDHVTIASKEIKDSHYQADVTLDHITKGDKKMILVCAYLRDSYLGRYLIKRNFYFSPDNQRDATATYDETISRLHRIKARYHEDRIPVNAIFTEIKSYLDGVKSDISFNGDDKGG